MNKYCRLIFFGLLSLSLSLNAAEILPIKSSAIAHVLRLGPDEDPKLVLMNYVIKNKISAASIASVVGSLKVSVMRYANQKEAVKLEGFREVVALSGTLGVSDGQGVTLGGHLGEGSKVYTTLEIVLLSYPELEFERILDPKTTYQELSIKPKPKK
jgi:predicted DNA-binding protein with PD1-like motif